MEQLSDLMQQVANSKNIDMHTLETTVKEFITLAYKRINQNEDNVQISFDFEHSQVNIFSLKTVVETVNNPILEIDLVQAQTHQSDVKIGHTLSIPIDLKDFSRISVQIAKQKIYSDFKEMQCLSEYNKFKDKLNQLAIGYIQRERNGTIFLDINRVEAILPRSQCSARDTFKVGDKVKVLIKKVERINNNITVICSRSDSEFVKKLLEEEILEIYEGIIKIKKIVRLSGYKTKLLVYSTKTNIDPVGTCVGVKGIRIQSIIRELNGEKIDIIPYTEDIKECIKRVLIPAEIRDVLILDQYKKKILVAVAEEQLSLAVGKKGMNVRLASRLVDWNIDIKTEEQIEELNIQEMTNIPEFSNDLQEVTHIMDLPGLPNHIVLILQENGIEFLEQLVSLNKTDLCQFKGLNDSDANLILSILNKEVQILDDDQEEESNIYQLPGLDEHIVQILHRSQIFTIEKLVELTHKDLLNIEGLGESDAKKILDTIQENVEIIEEEDV